MKLNKVSIINYAEGREEYGDLIRGLLVSIDGEERYFCPSDDLKFAMKRFKKLQDKGYQLKFTEDKSWVNPEEFLLVKKEYRD